jgi:MFS family permease
MKKRRPEPSRAVVVLCAAQFVDVLGVTELISALPRALGQLGASPAAAGPAVTAYAMCFGGLLMLSARLGTRLGHQRMLRLGLTTFAAGSILAALAPAIAVLVAARCLQGIAAAFSVPAALSLLLHLTGDPRARGRAMAAWSAAGGAAGACGFALGGAVTELAGWRALFWLNIPLAAAVWIALVTTPELRDSQRRASGALSDPALPLDLAGATLLCASAMSLVLGASLLPDAATRELGLALAGLSAAAAIGFRIVERRARAPLFPPGTLRSANLRTGTIASFLNTATTSSSVAIATLELQRQQHLNPGAAAVRLIPMSLGAVGGALLAGRLQAVRPHRIVLGWGLRAIACGDATLVATPGASWLLPIGVTLAGVGIGLSSASATRIGTDVPPRRRETAAGTLSTAAQLGSAVGTAALLCLSELTAGDPLPLSGARLGWLAAAVLALAGAAALGTQGRASAPARASADREDRSRFSG